MFLQDFNYRINGKFGNVLVKKNLTKAIIAKSTINTFKFN
jgi:hypothetical protein